MDFLPIILFNERFFEIDHSGKQIIDIPIELLSQKSLGNAIAALCVVMDCTELMQSSRRLHIS